MNIAKTHGAKDRRTVPLSSLVDDDSGPTVEADRFQGPDGRHPGHWREAPAAWPSPETAVIAQEVRRTIGTALDDLPDRQRIVITLRDVDGYTSEEVCAILEISPANQRVLLHRARAVVRGQLEHYFTATSGAEGVRA